MNAVGVVTGRAPNGGDGPTGEGDPVEKEKGERYLE